MIKSRSDVVILQSSVGSLPKMSLVNAIRKQGAKVIGIDSDPMSAGLYLCDKSYVIHRAENPKYLKDILRICDADRPNLMLTGPDKGTLVISKNKKLLAKHGVLALCPDYETSWACINKWESHKKLTSLNIPIPEIYSKKNVKFPCIIKPRFGSGGTGVQIIHDKHEMNNHISKIKEPIIQEFIQGTEYSIDLLSDLDGVPLSIVPRTRIQTESGVSTKGMTVYDKKIINYCDKISRKLKLVGPSCIQCIKNDEGVKFIEVNLRFGGGSILSINANSSIIPNLIRIAKGQKPRPHLSFKTGLIMLRYYNEVFFPKEKILKMDLR